MNTTIITLRPFRPEDQERILDILVSPIVNKTYMLPDYETREDAIPLFNRLSGLSRDRSRFVRCIALGDEAIGFLNDVEIQDSTIELGYVIHPDHHNRGYMTQALTAAIAELGAAGYHCVTCGAFEENRASQRVMEKAGMMKIHHTDIIEYRGISHTCVYYEIQNPKGDPS